MSKKENLEPKFDFMAYNMRQIMDALTCPLNRHATRVEKKCSDFELHANPEWLIEHYIRCGGAIEFAKRRAEFVSLCEFADNCRFSINCKLALTHSGYAHCPLRRMDERCRTVCNFDNCPSQDITTDTTTTEACGKI